MVTPLEYCENITISSSQTELEVGKQMYCCSSGWMEQGLNSLV